MTEPPEKAAPGAQHQGRHNRQEMRADNHIDSLIAQLHYAPEVEKAIVSLLWNHPHLIELATLPPFDPETHIVEFPLRVLLDQIATVFRVGGSADFALVVTALREIRMLEECGGIPGVNSVYDYNRYFFSRDPETLLQDYLRELAAYAEQRKIHPDKMPIRYNCG
jgi:hypothetical protein